MPDLMPRTQGLDFQWKSSYESSDSLQSVRSG